MSLTRTPRARTLGARLAALLLATLTMLGLVAGSAVAAATGTVSTGGDTLNLRSAPTGSVIGSIPDRTVLTITCQTTGPYATGPWGATNVWDKVTYGGKTGYVADAFVYTGTNGRVAPDCGTATPPPPSDKRAAIVNTVRSQLGVTEGPNNCNPYGPCVEWCGLFATWAWNRSGISTPSMAFTGDIYWWGNNNGRLIKTYNNASTVLANAKPGDMVLYGSGPGSPSTSWHVDVVESNNGGSLTVIGGNVSINGDGVRRWTISHSSSYTLSNIYAIISAR